MHFRPLIPALLAAVTVCPPAFSQGRGQQQVTVITLRGTVRDAETGAAVTQARVAIRGMAGNYGSETSVGSSFLFDNIPLGYYEITVEAEGYKDFRESLSVNVSMQGQLLDIPLQRLKFAETPPSGSKTSSRELQLSQKAREAYHQGLDLLYDKNNPEKSVPLFQQTLQAAPKFYEARYHLGVALEKLGKLADAEAAYREVNQMSEGKYGPAEISLASLLAGANHFPEAEQAARKGLESNPDSARGHYELSRALVGQSKWDEAEKEALVVLKLTKDLPQTYLLLAAAHSQQQRPEEAVKDLDEYLKLVPTGPVSDNARAARDSIQSQIGSAPASVPQKPQ